MAKDTKVPGRGLGTERVCSSGPSPSHLDSWAPSDRTFRLLHPEHPHNHLWASRVAATILSRTDLELDFCVPNILPKTKSIKSIQQPHRKWRSLAGHESMRTLVRQARWAFQWPDSIAIKRHAPFLWTLIWLLIFTISIYTCGNGDTFCPVQRNSGDLWQTSLQKRMLCLHCCMNE